jgi:RNA polymerase sigma-70 factor (ECF subfamily)
VLRPTCEAQAVQLRGTARLGRPFALRRAIEELPEKYRTVITLYHLQGRQYEEIATVLGMPLGTVKTHLFRAKELLRKKLVNE